MGFKKGAFATVWQVDKQERYTKVRISTSRKNRESGEYEQDFSGYCSFVGEAHKLGAGLSQKDRIRLGDCEVTTKYNKENGQTFTNFTVFSFEIPDDSNRGTQVATRPDNGEVDVDDDGLPF